MTTPHPTDRAAPVLGPYPPTPTEDETEGMIRNIVASIQGDRLRAAAVMIALQNYHQGALMGIRFFRGGTAKADYVACLRLHLLQIVRAIEVM